MPDPAATPNTELEDDPLDTGVGDDLGDGLGDDGLSNDPAETTPDDGLGQPGAQDTTSQWGPEFARARDEFGLTDIPDDPRLVAQQISQLRQSFAQEAQQRAFIQNLYFQAQQQALRQQAPQPAPQPQKPARVVPEWNPAWVNMVQKDEHGNLIALPGVMPDIPQKILAYQEWRTKESDRLLHDPTAYMREHFGTELQAQARQIAAESVRQYQVQAQSQQIAAQVNPWALARDTAGNVLVDQFTGRPQMTPLGAHYAQTVDQLFRAGIQDPQMQHTLAMNAVQSLLWQQSQQGAAPGQQQPAGAQAAPTHAQQQMDILRNGARGTQPQTPPREANGQFRPIKGRVQFGQALRQRMRVLPKEAYADLG